MHHDETSAWLLSVETEQHGELNCWRITSNHAELLIAQQGAQVLSYQRLGEPHCCG